MSHRFIIALAGVLVLFVAYVYRGRLIRAQSRAEKAEQTGNATRSRLEKTINEMSEAQRLHEKADELSDYEREKVNAELRERIRLYASAQTDYNLSYAQK